MGAKKSKMLIRTKIVKLGRKKLILRKKESGCALFIDNSGKKTNDGNYITDDGRYPSSPFFYIEKLDLFEVELLWNLAGRLKGE